MSNNIPEILGTETDPIIHEITEKGKIIHVAYRRIYKTTPSLPDAIDEKYKLYDVITRDGYYGKYCCHYFIFTYRKVFEQ